MKDFDFDMNSSMDMDLDAILAEFSASSPATEYHREESEKGAYIPEQEIPEEDMREPYLQNESGPVPEISEPEDTQTEDFLPVVPGHVSVHSEKSEKRSTVPNARRRKISQEEYYDDFPEEYPVKRRGNSENKVRTAGPERAAGPDSAGRSDRTGKSDRAAGPDRAGKSDRAAGPERTGKSDRAGKDRSDKSEISGRPDKSYSSYETVREQGKKTAGKAANAIVTVARTFTGLVFGAAALLVLGWMLLNVHPDSSMASTQITSKNRANIVTQLDSYANNAKGELLSDLTYIRKHYLIPEGDLVAPEAPTYNYGTTDDPQEVLAVIEEARSYGLLDGQSVIFNENVDFYYDSDIQYYCDESLLVICWKELIDNRICSCVEVKMADGSQFRRKLAEDTYGSSTYVYATELAAQCNAVVAMNADYYAFRDLGITVYNRNLYRFDDANYNGQYSKYNATDSLMIDSNGDFHVFHKGETSTRAAMEQYIKDNNIMFSVAFGPVLVEDWGQVWCDWYPVGEVDKEYSRAGIAQYDTMHYLYMTVSFADNQNEYHPRCTINEFAAIMAGKGVKTAYCLDGGQTGEVVFRGKPYNHIDFGTERTVSDIIYFATAIPESER